ncbi:MAG: formylglycine-generating enzyme family protein [Lewinellaceae bacterium]|nr:formylglycine-generating enzyme family protein [Lewinellaceae bacterium]
MSKYPVTQSLYEAVTGGQPSMFKGSDRPLEKVSWQDAQDFIQILNGRQDVQEHFRQLKLSGLAFRLPTEAEWEYAARGGRCSQGYLYAGSDKLKQVGWYTENSGSETKEVGLLLPNELGLYDMSGNVWEWCEDDWHDNYQGAPEHGTAWVDAPERGASRVDRGGGYFHGASRCRCAARGRNAPVYRYGNLGFRLAASFQAVG